MKRMTVVLRDGDYDRYAATCKELGVSMPDVHRVLVARFLEATAEERVAMRIRANRINQSKPERITEEMKAYLKGYLDE